jgi:aminopeptidase N
VLQAWLRGDQLPGGLTVDADLRARILFTLAARGLASDEDIDALAGLDPAGGEPNRATCLAMRPDPEAKSAAWAAALSGEIPQRMAQAHARGIWVPGQEELMAGYRERFFAEAVPELAGRTARLQQRLGRALFPATLVSAKTIEIAEIAGTVTDVLATLVAEQTAIMRSVLAAREQPRRAD